LQSGRLKKLSEIRGQNNAKKGFDNPVDSPFEWQLAFCLQQNVLMGGGVQKSLREDQHFRLDPTAFVPASRSGAIGNYMNTGRF
jgi:hypothetical protein